MACDEQNRRFTRFSNYWIFQASYLFLKNKYYYCSKILHQINQGFTPMEGYQKYTDQELTALLKEGDRAVFTEIFNRYHAALYIHAFKRLQQREESRDLVQDLFTTLWAKRNELTFKTTLSGYLYMSVRNRIFDLLARQRLNDVYISSIQQFELTGYTLTDGLIRQKQLANIIDQEIEALPPRTKEIFELSRKRFLSHKEIAQALNLSEQTVKTTVNNALKTLRAKLGTLLFLSV
ncbi:ECF RNA polymerase sigma factor SigW [compost metagenome]